MDIRCNVIREKIYMPQTVTLLPKVVRQQIRNERTLAVFIAEHPMNMI